jgi:hypothetical protein
VQSRALRQRIVMNGQQEQGLVSLVVCLQRYETVSDSVRRGSL